MIYKLEFYMQHEFIGPYGKGISYKRVDLTDLRFDFKENEVYYLTDILNVALYVRRSKYGADNLNLSQYERITSMNGNLNYYYLSQIESLIKQVKNL